jgi:hypothetical protein
MSFISEVKRHSVIGVTTACVVGCWLIIQLADTTFSALGFGDTVLRVITILLGVALIPRLVSSWPFELTPERFTRKEDVAREDSVTRYNSRRIGRIIMVLPMLALWHFPFDRLMLTPARKAAALSRRARFNFIPCQQPFR